MTTPTCWYCPVQYCGYVASQSGRCPNHEDKLIEHWLLGPGCNLPTALREAGYDVREGIIEVRGENEYVELDNGRAVPLTGTRIAAVVLPDEKDAS